MSKDEIIERLKDNSSNYIKLYRWLENYVGDSESLCSFLLEDLNNLKSSIPTLTRAGEDRKSPCKWKYLPYRDNSRNGEPQKQKDDEIFLKTGKHRRAEDYLAMSIFSRGKYKEAGPIQGLGYILDYQTPIGGTPTLLKIQKGVKYNKNDLSYPYGIIDPDKALDSSLSKDKQLFRPGKCDLIAYDNNCFTILELKVEGNAEPMLRAVMEAYTYRKMIDHIHATESFQENYRDLGIPSDAKWEAAVLLSKRGSQFDEYNDTNNINLRRLMKELEIKPIWYSQDFVI